MKDSDDIKLKPCPFCGGEATYINSEPGNCCRIVCSTCRAESKTIYYSPDFAAKELVIKLWNQRVGDPDEQE